MDPDQQEQANKDATLAAFQATLDAHNAAEAKANEEIAARHLAAMKVATPADLAEILNAPGDRTAMIAAAHKRFGNAFVEDAVGLADAKRAADGKASADLTKQYGLRPRKYAGMVDGTNAAELVFRHLVPEAVGFINAQAEAKKMKFRLTVAELTTNFIAEGGNYILDSNQLEGIDGFASLGIDTFMDRYNELKPWLHPCLAKDRLTQQEAVNEKNEKVTSITNLTIVQAVYASAAMLAHAQAALEVDMRSRPGGFDGLTDRQETYFTTTYYNAGPGYGKKLLQKQGAKAADRKWTGTDDHGAHSRSPHFNATMRTSTWQNLRDNVLDGDQFRHGPHGQVAEDARLDVDTQEGGMRARLARAEEELAEAEKSRADLQGQVAGVDPEDQAALKQNIESVESTIRWLTQQRANLKEMLDALAAAETQLPPVTSEGSTP